MPFTQALQIFVLDDDEFILERVDSWFREEKIMDYSLFKRPDNLLSNLNKWVHICIIDYKLNGDMNGLEAMSKIKEINPYCYFGLLTAIEDFNIAVEFNHLTMRGKIIPKWKFEEEDTRSILINFIKTTKSDIEMINHTYKEMEEGIIKLKKSLKETEEKVDKFFKS